MSNAFETLRRLIEREQHEQHEQHTRSDKLAKDLVEAIQTSEAVLEKARYEVLAGLDPTTSPVDEQILRNQILLLRALSRVGDLPW